jgi:hypothetical protein
MEFSMTARLSGTARVTIACLVVAITAGAGVAAMLLQQRAKDRINSQPLVADFSQSRDWLALGGAWTAKADLAANTSEERGARLINRSIVRGDYQLDSDLRLDTLYGEAGLIFRASEAGEEGVDAYHGYFAGVRPTERVLEFGRADFGWQLLAQKALPESADPTQWIHMRVVAVGCNFGITATFSDGSSTSVEEPAH